MVVQWEVMMWDVGGYNGTLGYGGRVCGCKMGHWDEVGGLLGSSRMGEGTSCYSAMGSWYMMGYGGPIGSWAAAGCGRYILLQCNSKLVRDGIWGTNKKLECGEAQ